MMKLMFLTLHIKENPCASLSSITVALCLLTLLLMALRSRKSHHHHSHLDHTKYPPPPGPTPWPLVGNLLQMGDQIHLSLTRLRLRYGDIFKVFTVKCVLIFGLRILCFIIHHSLTLDASRLFDCRRPEWIHHHQTGAGSAGRSFCWPT